MPSEAKIENQKTHLVHISTEWDREKKKEKNIYIYIYIKNATKNLHKERYYALMKL